MTIPKNVRDALNPSEHAKLISLQVPGKGIVLTKEPAWEKLRGAAVGGDLMDAFETFKNNERERETGDPEFRLVK